MPTLRLCTAGSVDDGKSTFVGRLLHDTKSILADQYESVVRASTAKGLENPDLSLLVDGLRAEREQGITIDVAYRYFATDKRSFILADTPGHVQYTRNTITGLSTSELVVILIDARNGVTEQTKRHLAAAELMDIGHAVIAVNKIDAVGYDQAVFDRVRAEVEQLSQHIERVDVVPISALLGDNVVTPSGNTPWYEGPSVLEILETAEVPAETHADLRLPVQLVIRDHASDYRGYAGRIAAGAVELGQQVEVAGRHSEVVGIDTPDGPAVRAEAGESITLRLADEIDISRGDLITTGERPEAVNQFTARVFHLSEQPVRSRAKLLLRYGTAVVRARIDAELEVNDMATVTITTAEPLPVEPYRRGGKVGSLLLIDPASGDTLTAGLVGEGAKPRTGEPAKSHTDRFGAP
ncbi:sulfate adenylyltransferase subunit 1 [Corynebacterium heidelbergense]|uniref:sulfate adenylyltransferase n=1 Tax=Corynebacterium heidelbergense TaxID=2055947 RepID=A0A364V6Y5_9CORY|nr:GTP-binding protein [Corynebacterium heidelbergense]RAV32316.1 sulfate adenylyltransferase [Corynebacterium heidelbergense]